MRLVRSLHHLVTHKRKQRSLTKLASHLEWIIEWEKNQDIPDKPHIEVQQRKNDATLGTQTLEAQKLDEVFDKKTESIKGEVDQLRNIRVCHEPHMLCMYPYF